MRPADNPFRISRVHALPFLWPPTEDFSTLCKRWESNHRRGAIQGPHGQGKSTLLKEWQALLTQRGWNVEPLVLTEDQPRLEKELFTKRAPHWDSSTIVTLDGAERLPMLTRIRFYKAARRAGGLIITRHRRGPLPTLLHCQTTWPQVLTLATKLLGKPPDPKTEDFLHTRYRERKGEVRLVWRDIYDYVGRWSTLPEAGKPPPQ